MKYGCYLEHQGKEREGSQHQNFEDGNNENLNLEFFLCYFDFSIVNSLWRHLLKMTLLCLQFLTLLG